MSINPMEIRGNWDKGYVLDNHVLESISRHENAQGPAQFDTTRTPLGELMFELKYRGRYSAANDILEMIKPFLASFTELQHVNLVIPAPASTRRDFQPVDEIAMAIANYLHIPFTDAILVKTSPLKSKNMSKSSKKLAGSIVARKKAGRPINILLVDDLYESGKTLHECVSVLRDDSMIRDIYVLAMTKTR